MNKATIGLVAGFIVIAILGLFLMQRNNTAPITPSFTPEENAEQTVTQPSDTPVPSGTSMKETNAKSFTLEAANFSFSLPEIRVKKGDTVTITLQNKEGNHDWVIDEFNAKTKRVGAGQSDTVSFVADKAGTFEYYCSVGKHRQMGMKGKLIVE